MNHVIQLQTLDRDTLSLRQLTPALRLQHPFQRRLDLTRTHFRRKESNTTAELQQVIKQEQPEAAAASKTLAILRARTMRHTSHESHYFIDERHPLSNYS
jgi:hypothetical protein